MVLLIVLPLGEVIMCTGANRMECGFAAIVGTTLNFEAILVYFKSEWTTLYCSHSRSGCQYPASNLQLPGLQLSPLELCFGVVLSCSLSCAFAAPLEAHK